MRRRRRHTWRHFFYRAECLGCDFLVEWTKNALGLAAQHHDRTGHSIEVDIEGGVTYLNDEDHEKRIAERAGRT